MILSPFPETPGETVERVTSADKIDSNRTTKTAALSSSDTADTLKPTPPPRSTSVGSCSQRFG
jgi:hypothetical protein